MAGCLIRGGLVVDGTGAPGVVGDVAVRDGRIVPVEEAEPGSVEVDATGLVVAPGFVDLHTHLREPGPGGLFANFHVVAEVAR